MLLHIARQGKIFIFLGFITILLVGARDFGSTALVSQVLWVDDDDPSCGGASPCYRTIQEAIAAAQPGDTIKIRPGTYVEQVEIDKDLVLMGESKDLVFIRGAASEGLTSWGLIRITQAVAVKVENVTVSDGAIGVYMADPNAQLAISNARFSKLIIAIMAAADAPSDKGQLTVLNSEISTRGNLDIGLFIALGSPLLHRIEGNQFVGSSTAISITGKSVVIISKNKLVNSIRGMEIKGSTLATIQANIIQNNGNGIKIYEGARAQISENQIVGNLLNGVIVYGNAQAALIDNQITANGLLSKSLDGPYHPFFGFWGAELNPEGFGIVIGDAAEVELTKNRLESNLFGLGITPSLDPSSKQLLIPRLNAQKNQIVANGWGVLVGGGEVTMSDNEIIQNDFATLGIELDPLARLLNLLEFFPTSGVLVQGGQPLLQSNRIMQNSSGIVLQGQASPRLMDNQIANNLQYGIALYQKPCFDTELTFQGEVLGKSNELSSNGKGDLCPADYPWPPGFRK